MRYTLLTLALFAAPALGQVDDGQANWDAGDDHTRQVEVGVQLFGFVNGSFLDEPSDKDKMVTFDDGTTSPPLLYPGFGDVGGGGGLTVSGMWHGIVGLETGIIFSLDQGTGTLSPGAGTDIDYTVGQNAIHIPLLLKVSAPLKTVRPFGYFGIDWAFVSDVAVQERDPDSSAAANLVDVEAENYYTLAFGVGFEFLIPAGVDLRIPLTFRGSWNPNTPTKAQDRMTTVPEECGTAAKGACTQFIYNTEWQYQAAISLGIAYYFL